MLRTVWCVALAFICFDAAFTVAKSTAPMADCVRGTGNNNHLHYSKWAVATALPDLPRNAARDAILALVSALRGGPCRQLGWCKRFYAQSPTLFLLFWSDQSVHTLLTQSEIIAFGITLLPVPPLPDFSKELFPGFFEKFDNDAKKAQLLPLCLMHRDIAQTHLSTIETVVFLAADRVVLNGCGGSWLKKNSCMPHLGKLLVAGRNCPPGFQCFASDLRSNARTQWEASKFLTILPASFDTSVIVIRPHLPEAQRFFFEMSALLRAARSTWVMLLQRLWMDALQEDLDNSLIAFNEAQDAILDKIGDPHFDSHLQSSADLWNLALALWARIDCNCEFAGWWRVQRQDGTLVHIQVSCNGTTILHVGSHSEYYPLRLERVKRTHSVTVFEVISNLEGHRFGSGEKLMSGKKFMPACIMQSDELSILSEDYLRIGASSDMNGVWPLAKGERRFQVMRWTRVSAPPWLRGPPIKFHVVLPWRQIELANLTSPLFAECIWRKHLVFSAVNLQLRKAKLAVPVACVDTSSLRWRYKAVVAIRVHALFAGGNQHDVVLADEQLDHLCRKYNVQEACMDWLVVQASYLSPSKLTPDTVEILDKRAALVDSQISNLATSNELEKDDARVCCVNLLRNGESRCSTATVADILQICPTRYVLYLFLSKGLQRPRTPRTLVYHRSGKRVCLSPYSDMFEPSDLERLSRIIEVFTISSFLFSYIFQSCPVPLEGYVRSKLEVLPGRRLLETPLLPEGRDWPIRFNWRNETRDRFQFGKNWYSFHKFLTVEHLWGACKDLQAWLGTTAINNHSVLDIGCGSGLHSLCFVLHGARKVFSIDYGVGSVRSAERLRETFGINRELWAIRQGSVLDQGWMATLGVYDIVYSWGVPEHTGDVWKAIRSAATRVAPHGILYIATGPWHTAWRTTDLDLKLRYGKTNSPEERGNMYCEYFNATCYNGIPKVVMPNAVRAMLDGRGMVKLHDHLDYLGGYPWEVVFPRDLNKLLEGQGQFITERSMVYTVKNSCQNDIYIYRRLSH